MKRVDFPRCAGHGVLFLRMAPRAFEQAPVDPSFSETMANPLPVRSFSTTVDFMLRSGRVIVLSLSCFLLASCAAFRSTPSPIPSIQLMKSANSRCLVVLLPGVHSSPRSFGRAGFVDIANKHHLDANVVAVDAHMGYYRKRTVIDRVRADIVRPALENGVKEVWIVGTSLGGLGSILYMRDHPEDLSGVVAIAPFLGDKDVIDEIELAGGPDQWTPPDSIEDGDVGRELWSWISRDGISRTGIPLYLGWGTEDDFDRSNRLLSTLLPPDRSYITDGGHDWKTWAVVWDRFLERAQPCSRVGAEGNLSGNGP